MTSRKVHNNPKLAILVLGAIAVMAQSTMARADEEAAAPARLEKVEVTGSSIKRTIEDETALPVQVITHDEIQRSGFQQTEELLRSITATAGMGGTQTSSGSGATTAGAATVSLRGLGSQRTLVLINGRRSTVYGGVPGSGAGDTAVDINSIPVSAIERVEVLKDGASAIYGSDAIAGVINFILRSNYNHGEISVSDGETLDGGAGLKKITATVGFGDLLNDKYNVMISGNYQKEDALYGRQRGFANTIYHPGTSLADNNNSTSGNVFPANVVTPNTLPSSDANYPNDGSTRNPVYLNTGACAPSIHLSGNACRFDFGPYVALVPASERTNLLASGHLQINDDSQLYGDMAFAHQKTTYTIQSSPLSDLFAVPASNPYNAYVQNILNAYPGLTTLYPSEAFLGNSSVLLLPGTAYYNQALAGLSASQQAAILLNNSPIPLRFRAVDAGPRSLEDVNDAYRAVGGIKGLAFGWDYDASLLFNQSKVKESTLSGYVEQSAFLPFLDTGVINPFGPSTAAGQTAINSATYNGEAFASKSTLAEFGLKVSHEVADIPGGGPVAVALGTSLRQEKFDFTASSQIASGDISGYGGNFLDVSKSRHVSAAFAEIEAQVTKKIELDGAVRYEDYQGTGSTLTPKVSGRWQVDQGFLVRSSWGKGFRAPSLTDLYAPNTQGVSSLLSDPLAVCNGTGTTRDCNTQFTTINGGNAKLKPEKSENFSLGLVWQPTQDFLGTIDYFHINLSDTITLGGLGATTVLSSPQYANTYAQFINRDAGGHIISINQQNANLFNTRTSGFDFSTRWTFLKNDTGRWTAGLDGTYVTKYSIQQSDGTYIDVVDSDYASYTLNGNLGVITRLHLIGSLHWDTADWATTFNWNFQNSYTDAESTGMSGAIATAVANGETPPPLQLRTVSSYSTVDLQTQYSGIKGWKFALGARNLFNTAPPYSNYGGQSAFQGGYDASYADPRGRFSYVNITYQFK